MCQNCSLTYQDLSITYGGHHCFKVLENLSTPKLQKLLSSKKEVWNITQYFWLQFLSAKRRIFLYMYRMASVAQCQYMISGMCQDQSKCGKEVLGHADMYWSNPNRIQRGLLIRKVLSVWHPPKPFWSWWVFVFKVWRYKRPCTSWVKVLWEISKEGKQRVREKRRNSEGMTFTPEILNRFFLKNPL